MPNTNQLVTWATGAGANIAASPAAYAAMTIRQLGAQTGIADPVSFNNALRQASVVASMIGQFTADYGTSNVNDDGNVATLEEQYLVALQAVMRTFLASSTIEISPSAYWAGTFSAPQSFAPATGQTLNFVGSNPVWGTWNGSVMTLSQAGVYAVSANVCINAVYSTATTGSIMLSINKNTLALPIDEISMTGSFSTYTYLMNVGGLISCNVGDTLLASAYVYNPFGYFTSAVTANDTSYHTAENFFTIVKLV